MENKTMKKKLVDTIKYKIFTYTVMIIGFGLILYSIFHQDTPIMITGFGFLIVSMLLAFPMDFKEFNESKLKLKNDYNAVIDLIEEDKLEDAMDYTDKHIKPVSHKTYLTGIIIGRNGKKLTKIKLEK